VKHGKVVGFHAKHKTKGELPTKKYKSDKKLASIDSSDDALPAQTVIGMTSCGYEYLDVDTNEEVYTWFPCDIVEDDFTGAITYVPVN
jgi:hypothetical protein